MFSDVEEVREIVLFFGQVPRVAPITISPNCNLPIRVDPRLDVNVLRNVYSLIVSVLFSKLETKLLTQTDPYYAATTC